MTKQEIATSLRHELHQLYFQKQDMLDILAESRKIYGKEIDERVERLFADKVNCAINYAVYELFPLIEPRKNPEKDFVAHASALERLLSCRT